MTRVRQAGERIEELLATLRSASGDAAAPRRNWCGCCSASTATGSATSWTPSRPRAWLSGAVRDRLLADPLVESLLLLHDLHPLDVDTRIQRALDRVRPYLGSHAAGVEYLGVGPDGVARLRLEGSCHGCPSSTVTVRLAIEGAVRGRRARGDRGRGGGDDRAARAAAAADRQAAARCRGQRPPGSPGWAGQPGIPAG